MLNAPHRRGFLNSLLGGERLDSSVHVMAVCKGDLLVNSSRLSFPNKNDSRGRPCSARLAVFGGRLNHFPAPGATGEVLPFLLAGGVFSPLQASERFGRHVLQRELYPSHLGSAVQTALQMRHLGIGQALPVTDISHDCPSGDASAASFSWVRLSPRLSPGHHF